MKKFLGMAALVALGGCASIVSDNKSTTYIQTDPEQARCELHGQDFTRIVNTPASINLPSEASPITIACKVTGYKNTVQPLEAHHDGWIFGNIIFGGIIGGVVDLSRGAGKKYPPQILIILEPEKFASVTEVNIFFDREKQISDEKWAAVISKINASCNNTNSSQRDTCKAQAEQAEKDKKMEQDDIERRRENAIKGV